MPTTRSSEISLALMIAALFLMLTLKAMQVFREDVVFLRGLVQVEKVKAGQMQPDTEWLALAVSADANAYTNMFKMGLGEATNRLCYLNFQKLSDVSRVDATELEIEIARAAAKGQLPSVLTNVYRVDENRLLFRKRAPYVLERRLDDPSFWVIVAVVGSCWLVLRAQRRLSTAQPSHPTKGFYEMWSFLAALCASIYMTHVFLQGETFFYFSVRRPYYEVDSIIRTIQFLEGMLNLLVIVLATRFFSVGIQLIRQSRLDIEQHVNDTTLRNLQISAGLLVSCSFAPLVSVELCVQIARLFVKDVRQFADEADPAAVLASVGLFFLPFIILGILTRIRLRLHFSFRFKKQNELRRVPILDALLDWLRGLPFPGLVALVLKPVLAVLDFIADIIRRLINWDTVVAYPKEEADERAGFLRRLSSVLRRWSRILSGKRKISQAKRNEKQKADSEQPPPTDKNLTLGILKRRLQEQSS